jgi:hypothetical protein
MESIRRLRGITAIGAALAFLLLPTAALGELAKWDQARVTQIAEELAGAMKELRREIQAAPPSTDPTRQRARYDALEDIRVMTNSSRHLAGELKAGKGRDESFATWRRLDLLRRDVEENARKSMIPDPTMEKILKAGELLIRLTPYYKSEEEAGG